MILLPMLQPAQTLCPQAGPLLKVWVWLLLAAGVDGPAPLAKGRPYYWHEVE